MSRVGKKPIPVPKEVNLTVQGSQVTAKGPKGELSWELPPFIKLEVKDGEAQLQSTRDDKHGKSIYGTTRSLIANMVIGVSKGYEKELEIHGVGYRASMQGQKLVMSVGYSHPIEYTVPNGITVAVKDGTLISVSGPDKQLVGEVGARIKGFCPPEPYKGKGIRFKGEYVRRKVGKTVA